MGTNFDYVTYRPLSGDARDGAAPTNGANNLDDDDALLDVDATDVLESSDLTLRMDTEDESDQGSRIIEWFTSSFMRLCPSFRSQTCSNVLILVFRVTHALTNQCFPRPSCSFCLSQNRIRSP